MYIKLISASFVAMFFISGCGNIVDRVGDTSTSDLSQNIADKNRLALFDIGEENFQKCRGCHGDWADKKALGKSDIISKMQEKDIEKALFEYRSGARNSNEMGPLMRGQVADFSDEDISALAVYIYDLKSERLDLANKGFKIYINKYKNSCGISGTNFATQHTQKEWKIIEFENKLYEEFENSCSAVIFEDQYHSYLYEFVYMYASNSGNTLIE